MNFAVTLERPGPARQEQFLSAVRRSRALHKSLVSPPDTAGKYRQYVKNVNRPTHQAFLVTTKEAGELAGVVNVSEIVRGCFQSAYLGYYAFTPLAGKGMMRQGLTLVIRHCFNELKLHRLEANIQPENTRSAALVRDLGFRCEGLSPRYLKVRGRWRDHQRWAILREEW